MRTIKDIINSSFIVMMIFSYSFVFLESFENSLIDRIVDVFFILKKILIVLVGITLPFAKRGRFVSLSVVGIGVLLYLFTYALFPFRAEILQSVFFDYFGCLFIFHCVVSLERPFISIENYIVWIARAFCILIPFMLLTQLNVEMTLFLKSNYMSFANAIMVPLSITIYSFFIKRNFIDSIFSIITFLLLFLGSRGSMLSIILLIVVLLYQKYRKINLKNVLSIGFVIIVGIYVASTLIESNIIDFSDNRTLNFLTEGTNWEKEDRIQIASKIINETSNVVSGGGIFADRQILMQGHSYEVAYAHNVFVEFFADFGFVGLTFILWLYFKILKAMFKESDNQLYITVFFFTSAFQLLFSRSVLLEYNFFILLALVYTSRKQISI